MDALERLAQLDSTRRGALVVVRAHGGELHIRRVWCEDARAVYICSDENYARLAQGVAGLSPVGFPRQDVFVYDGAILSTHTGESVWGHLRPFAYSGERSGG